MSADQVLVDVQRSYLDLLAERDAARAAHVAAMQDGDDLRRQLATERARRCGSCADARPVPTDGATKRKCVSDASECYGWTWTVDHGCPWYRAKE